MTEKRPCVGGPKACWICRKGPDIEDKVNKTEKEDKKKVEYYILFRNEDARAELMTFVRGKVYIYICMPCRVSHLCL
jgi:hypothetical protein